MCVQDRVQAWSAVGLSYIFSDAVLFLVREYRAKYDTDQKPLREIKESEELHGTLGESAHSASSEHPSRVSRLP